MSLTAADLARSQAEMWAQRVAEAEAALCRTFDPQASARLRVLLESTRVLLEAQARSEAEQLAAKRWVTAVARQEAVQRQVATQNAAAVAAGIRAAGEAGRRAAHATSEAARIDYRETLHNGAWRGWGGLSPSERAETGARASNHWATDIDDTDGWTEHVIDSHLDLIPASRLYLSPRMGHYYGHGDYGDARE